ncbi:MAG TPA: GNAT family N-acetyltransferase [Vicinamibacterales bacterium]|nr:GNAT family N-acetyltransferase [Vicinamibacterales bacterium]
MASAEIAAVRVAAADRLTRDFGDGHWSAHTYDGAVMRDIAVSRVLVARSGEAIVGTLTLQTKKPWAIDLEYFTPVKKAIYLINMAVAPDHQRTGVGRALLERALLAARGIPAQAIRLDAYDGPAGAGKFYSKCGYTPRGGKIYRGTPLLYFELMTHLR